MPFCENKTVKSASIIYEVKGYAYDQLAKKYPVTVETVNIGRYSTLEKAESAIKERISVMEFQDPPSGVKFHSCSIQEAGIDVPYRDSLYDERIYDELGTFYGTVKDGSEPFAGVDHRDCRFEKANLVEFISEGKIRIGIVFALPPEKSFVEKVNARFREMCKEYETTDSQGGADLAACDQTDNTYGVIYGLNWCSHEHLEEARLFKPKFKIPRRKGEYFRELYRYKCHVFRTFEEFENGQSAGFLEIQLNGFLLDYLKEPHVVISGACDYLVVSLESFTILRGNPKNFKREEIETAVEFIKGHAQNMKDGFQEMLESGNS